MADPENPDQPPADPKEDVTKTHTARAMCKTEKGLMKARTSSKMVFTKKVNLFKDRVLCGDHIDALRYLYLEVERKFEVLDKNCIELLDFYIDKDFSEDLINEALTYGNKSEGIKCDLHCQLLKLEAAANSSDVANGSDVNLSVSSGAISKLKPKLEAIKLPKLRGHPQVGIVYFYIW